MARLVKVYDTTLRDGTQGEGVTFSMEDKVRLAQRLDALGVHYIEGGWPGSNPKDMEFFERQVAWSKALGLSTGTLKAQQLFDLAILNQVLAAR